MKHLSLFSGIGGFDLAAEWMGWENISHTEWNEFGQYNLNNHWPKAQSHGDITKTVYTIYNGRVDIVTGGFPCQPYSVAGKRKGKDDERHLWPEMLRAIREIAPRWVVGENVGGLVNWNGGMVFDEVQADLEAEGYEILPFLLPAASVNAPHRRDRIWFVAYSTGSTTRSSGKSRKFKGIRGKNNNEQKSRGITAKLNNGCCELLRRKTTSKSHNAKNTDCNGWNGEFREKKPKVREQRNIGARDNVRVCPNDAEIRFATNPESSSSSSRELQQQSGQGKSGRCDRIVKRVFTDTSGTRQSCKEHREIESGRITKTSIRDDWQNFPTQSPVCDGDDGFPTESLRQFFREDSNGVIPEEEIDKILSSAYTQWRNETIKAGGNAIVPQVVYQIFKAIQQYELS